MKFVPTRLCKKETIGVPLFVIFIREVAIFFLHRRWPGSIFLSKRKKKQVYFFIHCFSWGLKCGSFLYLRTYMYLFRVKGFHRRAVKSVSFDNDANCVRYLCEIGLFFFVSFSRLLQFLVKWP